MPTPTRSAGSRSGVNWTRFHVQSMEVAIALARLVLPTPGTSSMRRWPSASRHITASSIDCCLPWSTWATLAVMASNSAANRVLLAPLPAPGRPGAWAGAEVTRHRVEAPVAREHARSDGTVRADVPGDRRRSRSTRRRSGEPRGRGGGARPGRHAPARRVAGAQAPGAPRRGGQSRCRRPSARVRGHVRGAARSGVRHGDAAAHARPRAASSFATASPSSPACRPRWPRRRRRG